MRETNELWIFIFEKGVEKKKKIKLLEFECRKEHSH